MSGSGARKRDTPDNEDFEGAPQESGQQPEEAPPEVAGAGGRERKRGGDDHGTGERDDRTRGDEGEDQG
ncbi:MAG TPA: hypothetical protein VHF90_05345 [Thermoleophilaceae bacterium]|nr:hypothetical protein [Thermoleophilaceae bacterium]